MVATAAPIQGRKPLVPVAASGVMPRLRYADVLRAGGIVAVVILHSAAPAVGHPGEIPWSTWHAANLMDSASRWCVPIFVMLSGALLLDPSRREKPGAFYRKRLGRIGIPLASWCAFYLWWTGIYFDTPITWRGALAAIALGSPYYHLYFLFVIAGLYLCTPILRAALAGPDPSIRRLAMVIPLVLASIGDLVSHLLNLGSTSALGLFVPYVGYFVAGHVLATASVSPRLRLLAPLGALAGIAATAGGAALCAHLQWPAGIDILYSSLSPNVIVTSLCLFIWTRLCTTQPGPTKSRSNQLLGGLADASLGIYVLHPLLFDLLRLYGVHLTQPKRWIDIPIVAALVFLVSFAITLILQKIPCVRRIVG